MASQQLPALCAILPSPEKLDKSRRFPGSDETDTLGDFNRIRKWLKQSRLQNIDWYYETYEDTGENAAKWENLENTQYYPFVQIAFSRAFDPMRNTASPDLEELVFWYYAGHGLGKVAAAQLSYSSTPCIDRVQISPKYHEAADQFVKEFGGRKVKGGELCLHKVGFCDLYGLLKPWIAAVKAQSTNAEGRKKNKHLVIILDSCYSGIIAQELQKFEKCMKKKDSMFLRENSVTIQAACGPNEGAFGGYFTPCFVYWNDQKNAQQLRYLKSFWGGMKAEVKHQFAALQLPSPMVVSTLRQFKQSQDVTFEQTILNFQFTLFRDPEFFKFCYIMGSQGLRGRTLDYLCGYLSFFEGEQKKTRSAWENSYLKHINKFNIPVVADN